MKLNNLFNRHLFQGCLLLLLLPACNHDAAKERHAGLQAPTKSEVEDIFRPFVEGNFEEYASHVASLRHLSKERLAEQLTLLRQHAAERDSVMGTIVGYSVRRVDYDENKSTATAYVEVVYSQGDTVDVLLPLIWQEDEWWRK